MNGETSLYVVTNGGQDVEKVQNFFELVLKKFGMGTLANYLNRIIADVMAVANSYSAILAINHLLDLIVKSIEELLGKLDPIWAAFFPQSFQRSTH